MAISSKVSCVPLEVLAIVRSPARKQQQQECIVMYIIGFGFWREETARTWRTCYACVKIKNCTSNTSSFRPEAMLLKAKERDNITRTLVMFRGHNTKSSRQHISPSRNFLSSLCNGPIPIEKPESVVNPLYAWSCKCW